MSRRIAISVSVVALVVVAVVLPGCQKQKQDHQVLAELDKSIRKWKSASDSAKKLQEQLRKDKETTLGQLRDLGIKSENDLSEKPKAQVLDKERTTINAHSWVCGKKIEVLDLAITKAEFKKKDITRRQQELKAEIAPAEITQALEELALADKELDEIESSTPPEITLEQDLNPQGKTESIANSAKKRVEKPFHSSSNPPMRKWTKTDGTTIEAEFVRHEKGKGVIVRQPDGKEITIKMPALSDEDKEYVKKMGKSQ